MYTQNIPSNNERDMNIPNFFDITTMLSTQDENALLQGNALTYISERKDSTRLKYTPSLHIFEKAISFIHKENPNILYESLFFIPEKNPTTQEKLITHISNALRKVSAFSTIEYQNLKNLYIHPLFKSSAVVISPDDHTIQDDLSPLTSLPASVQQEMIYIKQDMPPFGKVISKYQYRYNKYFSEFLSDNITPIAYKGIKAIQKHNMLISCWIIRTNEGILAYGINAVRISGLANLFGGVITNSFSSRMVGLFKWLHTQVDIPQEKQQAFELEVPVDYIMIQHE